MVIIAYNEIPILSFNPYTLAIQFAFDLLEWLGIIPDPIDLLFSLFSGRPREEATVQVIQRLQHSPNTAARIWGVELGKMLRNMDIVISDSSAFGQMMLSNSFHQFVTGLEAQGVSLARARVIGVNAMSRAAQAGAPLEPELLKPTPAQFVLTGPQAVLDTFQEGIKLGEAKNLLGKQLENFAEHYMWTHQAVVNLQQLQWIDPQTIPPQPGQGGDGTTTTGNGGGGQPSIQPGDDELGDLGNQLCQCLDKIASAISGQNPQPGSAGDCCAQVVSSISMVAGQLANIASEIAVSAARDPVAVNLDTTPIATALEALKASLDLLPGNADANTSRLVDAINAIRDAIPKAGATGAAPDLSEIVKQLTEANTLQDVPTSILQGLTDAGDLPEDLAPLLQGSPMSWVKAILDGTAERKFWHRWKKTALDNALHDPRTPPELTKVITADLIKNGGSPSDDAAWIQAAMKWLFETGFAASHTVFGGLIQEMLKAHKEIIGKFKNVKPGEEQQAATDLLTEAVEFGAGAHIGAVLGEAVYPTKTLGMPQIAALLSQLAGFHEIMRGIINPEVTQAISIPHRYAVNQTARAIQPSLGEAGHLYARRIIDAGQHASLAAMAGISTDYEAQMRRLSYRPIQPRALVTALADVPFPKDKLREILEDNGFSDSHVNFMLDAFEYNSTKNVRNAYITAAETAYGRGVISDDELDQIITDAGWSDVARDLVKKRVLLARRTELAHEVETQVTQLVAAGLMDAETGVQQIEASGVQEWLARLKVTLAETKATLQAARRAASEERKLEISRQRNLTRAAIAEYERGVIDELGLTSALTLLGLDPTLIASIVAVQSAARAGRLKFIYGQYLTPDAAELLRQQVAAVHEQRTKELIGDIGVVTALRALKLPDSEITALLSHWAAAGAAPSKWAELLPSS
jgi:hypothetical protein